MRKHFAHISAALALAALAVACTGRHERATHERISLRGCVQPAVVGEGYALRHVIVTSGAEQAQAQEPIEHPLIARGSWVRLAPGSGMNGDLKSYLNQEVTITGEVIDPGLNTIGTSGKRGSAQEQNPPRASIANGDAPRIAVDKVQKIAENCAGQ
jgi:hypothetical protein